MHSVIAIRILAVLLLTGALLYFVLRIWLGKRNQETKGKNIDFWPSIGFSCQDGFQSVAILLDNESDVHVWTEEIEIALTDLKAHQQTSEASCHEIQKIHQSVRPHDVLPISLVETIYNAAGRPQRKYSCVLSSVVRYRVGEKWYEEILKTYRLKMAGLTVAGIRRERKTAHQFECRDKSEDLHTTGTSSR